MKKLLLFLLTASVMLSLCSCKKEEPQSTPSLVLNSSSQVESESQSTAVCPDFVGLWLADVVLDPAYESYTLNVTNQYNSAYSPGEIFDQVPKAGEPLPEDGEILLVVSSKVATQVLQNYAGMDATVVRNELNSLGISYMEESVHSEIYPNGVVVATSPGAREEISFDSVVTLYVSIGRKPPLW